MCYALNDQAINTDKKKQRGLTLIEMAIALIIIGVIVGPAIGLYNLYIKNTRIQETTTAMDEAWRAINDFRTMYGRYPCPAPLDAIRTSSAYGHEAVNAVTGKCDGTLPGVFENTSQNLALSSSNNEVYVGALPFRKMNLREELINDGYMGRLTYAVTGIQTDDTTYEAGNGGITIEYSSGGFLTNPPHTAHFVIMSHGPRNAGAYNLEGNRIGSMAACGASSTQEAENCDFDEVFIVDQYGTDIDDVLRYGTTDAINQWQVSTIDEQNIHLRRSTSITMGIDETTSTVGFSSADIRTLATDDGVVKVTADVSMASSGRFMSSQLCNESGTSCFQPSLVAGQLAQGEGMACGAAAPFMRGVASGSPICDDEVTFECSDPNDFIVGFDSNGRVICNTIPAAACPDERVSTVCGDTRTISGFWDSGVMYGYAYSGECYNIDPLNTPWLDSQTDLQVIRNYIDALNAGPRRQSDCGPGPASAQVRETFQCNGGSWDPSAIRTIERWENSPHNLNHPPTSGGNRAEAPGPAYTPASPMSVDPSNRQGNHDCWCREDYRLDTRNCSGASTGQRFRILMHRCPATRENRWRRVYPSRGWDTRFCGCTPSSGTETRSCQSHFGYRGPGITGNVVVPYDITCPSGSSGSPSVVYGTPDISACRCPTNSTDYLETACPYGETNDFWYDGNHYVGVSQVRKREWVCPGGTPPQPATSAADAGYYTITETHNEACACNSSLTTTYTEPCPAGQDGTGIHYELPWNCTLGRFEDPAPAYETSRDCRVCVWQYGSGPRIETIAAPVQAGSACSSCSGVSSCFTVNGPGSYNIWDGCYCAAQP